MTNKIKQNKEIIWIILATIVATIFLANDASFVDKYTMNNFNNILLPVFGVLFGSLITAYTITIAFSNQIPQKIKETRAYKRVNLDFLITLFSLLILMLISIVFYFIDGGIILFITLFLSIFSFLMFFYLILIIYMLVRIINNRF